MGSAPEKLRKSAVDASTDSLDFKMPSSSEFLLWLRRSRKCCGKKGLSSLLLAGFGVWGIIGMAAGAIGFLTTACFFVGWTRSVIAGSAGMLLFAAIAVVEAVVSSLNVWRVAVSVGYLGT